MSSSDSLSFVSCESGNDTFTSCLSEDSNGSRVMDRSQDSDITTVEAEDASVSETDVDDEKAEENEEGEDVSSFEQALNDEAMDALEESLKLQLAALEKEEMEFMQMSSRVEKEQQSAVEYTMEKSEDLKKKIALLENETKGHIVERDQALSDLRNVEQAFSDVHRKYERAKQVLENLKINEEHLMERDEEFQLQISARDQKGEAFKQEVDQSMERMFNDFQSKLATYDSENSQLALLHRRAEMKVETLESELAHKQKENAQLNSLADDLIGRNVK